MYRVTDDISVTDFSVEEGTRLRKDFLAPIRSCAHIHVITLNDTEYCANIFWQYSNLGKENLVI